MASELLKRFMNENPSLSTKIDYSLNKWGSGNTSSPSEEEKEIVAVRPNGQTVERRYSTRTTPTESPSVTASVAPSAPIIDETEKYSFEEVKPFKTSKIDTWLQSDYKLSKDEENEARQYTKDFYRTHKGINSTNPKIVERTRLSMTPEEQEEFRKVNALDNKVSNSAAFFGGAMDAVPFLRQALDKAGESLGAGEKSFSGTLENQRSQNPFAYGGGEFASKALQYGGLNGLLGEGKNLAGRLALGQTADTILDTIPTLVSNAYDNKYDTENGFDYRALAQDALKNQAENLAFNLGAEAVPFLIDGAKTVGRTVSNGVDELRNVNNSIDNAFGKNFTVDQIGDSLRDEARAMERHAKSNDLTALMAEYNKRHATDSLRDEAEALAKAEESNNLSTLMEQFRQAYPLNESTAKEVANVVDDVAKPISESVAAVPKVYDTAKVSDKELDKMVNRLVKMFGRGDDIDAVKGNLKAAINEYESTGSDEAYAKIVSNLEEVEKRLNGNTYTTQRSKNKGQSGKLKSYTYPTNWGTVTDNVMGEVANIRSGFEFKNASNSLNAPAMDESLRSLTDEFYGLTKDNGQLETFNNIKRNISNALNGANENEVETAIDAIITDADSLIKANPESRPVVERMVDGLTQTMKENEINRILAENGVQNPNANKVMAESVGLGKDAPIREYENIADQAADYANGATLEIDGIGNIRESKYANNLQRTDIPEDVVNAFAEEPLLYNQLKNVDTKAKADSILANNDFNGAFSQYKDMLSKRDPASIPLGYELANRMVDNGNLDGAIDLVEEMSKALTSSGQFSQAAAITMLKSDPMASMRMIQKEIQKINNTGAEKYGKKWKDFSLTDDEIKAFGAIKKGDTESIQNLYEQITKRMSKNYPSTTWEKIVEATKTAMMLNPRTHIRNVAANTAMSPVRSLADRVSALGQNIVHLINPDFKVTQSLTGGTTGQKKIANQIFDEQIKPLLEGGSKWEDVADNAARGKRVFNDSSIGKLGKDATLKMSESLNNLTGGRLQNLVNTVDDSMTNSVMENLRKFDYWLLGAVEDDPFVKSNFSNRLASYMKAQGINTLEDVPNDAIQTAYQEALKATFKDDNYMTKAFQSVKKGTGKFGEVLLPFVKTPANLAKRGIEYSPVGFVETLMTSKGKETAQLIDELSKNAVGTAGIFLGYQLAKNGLIQGALSDNKNEQSFEKQQGKQAFSINVDGHYYTFDWAQPASIPLVIGATINDAIEESDKENANYLNIAKQSAIAAGDAWADLSPVSSLQDILGGGDYSSGSITENVINEVTEFPQRLIPSVLGAAARTKDTTMRNTYSKNDAKKTWIDQAKAKIPGLSETLPASYDTWGRERKRTDSTASAVIANFANPGSLGYDASTPIDSEITRLFDSTGEVTVYPHKADWSVTVGDEKINLNNEQNSAYQKSMGEHSYELAEGFINSPEYANFDDNGRVETLSKMYSLSKSIAENELFGKEIPSTNQKLYEAYVSGGAEGVISYLSKKNDFENAGVNQNKTTDAIYEQSGSAGLEKYAEKKSAFDKYGINMENGEANAAYERSGERGLKEYKDTKDTIETYGLTYNDKSKDVYNNYGARGLTIQKKLNDLGSSAGSNMIPVLQEYNLNTSQIGEFIAKNASKVKYTEENPTDYEGIYYYYMAKDNVKDLNGNGKKEESEYEDYLNSLGVSESKRDKLIPYLKPSKKK